MEPGRSKRDLNRRDFLKTAAGAGAAMVLPGCLPPLFDDNGLNASVAVLRTGYDGGLAGAIAAGFELVPPPDVRGKRVLLKPNLVDLPRDGKPVVTDPAMIVAAAEAFRQRGAAEVIVADGPALQRDAWQILDAIGLTQRLADHELPFIDLNLSDVEVVPNAGSHTGLAELYCAKPVLHADVLVSMPKMKVHHWAGVTLSMKNMFGTLPGQVYGWPRNKFHMLNLHNGVLDFNLTTPPDYAIVDGVVGLEGDGPVRGTPIDVGVIVMGANPTAVDATAARVMGVRPEAVEYLRRSAGWLGPIGESSIEQRGETIASVRTPFQVLSHQAALTL